LTIESVTLMSPHNLTVHGGLVYEMDHSQHALILANGWAEMGQGADPIAWARRHAIPGAIIPPGHPAPLSPPLRTTNRYEIVPEVTANSPAGGWALGEIVTYRADGQLYTVDAELGLAIGPGPAPASCNAEVHAIEAAWR
jgi:hypothetical protein